MKIGSKLGVVAAIGALAIAVPASAKPGEHHPTKPTTPTKSHKCAVHKVAYRASGTLVNFTATKNSDGTYSGTIEVRVTNANHHAKTDKKGNVVYTLDHAKITFGHGANPPAAGDRVTVIGKITTVGKKCSNQSDAGTVTVGKVNIHTAHKSKHSK